MGQRLPALSIAYKVSYSDLNLGTHSGAVEPEKRIKDSAAKACQQLAKLYPETTEGDTMAQANKAIAAAESDGWALRVPRMDFASRVVNDGFN